jgi:hypothetical protein
MTGHCAEVIVRIIGALLADRDGNSKCSIVFELPKESRRDEICIWTSGHSSAHSSKDSRHDERRNSDRDSDCDRDRSGRGDDKGRSGANDRGNGARDHRR